MSYQVLALKYRPQTFNDVVGQPHVTTTLINAIQNKRVPHAILLTGPRGTGKTTIARILARAMNCTSGPTPTPCNHCRTCREILQGQGSDVIEIDGASNNSVDQIRDLRENAVYMPASAPFKIYIIDEVHMLTTAAFNALLKTLEEPPAHVMFIFATTEVHKIPATILSRCQRHDLGRVPLSEIIGLLERICRQESIAMDRQGLELIAMEGDGSIRDSLSLLDRILSWTGEPRITTDQVTDALGITDRKKLQDISEAVLKQNGATLLSVIEAIHDTGADLKKFYADLIQYFRDLTVIRLCGPDTPAVCLTDSEKRCIHDRVASLPESHPGTLLHLLLEQDAMVRFSSHTRIAVEAALLLMIQVRPDARLNQILENLDILSRQTETPPVYASPPPPPAETPRYATPPPTVSEVAESSPAPDDRPPWQAFLDRIRETQPSLFTLISRAQIQEGPDGTSLTATLQECTAFDKKRLGTRQTDLISQCLEITGKTLTIHIESEKKPPETLARDPAPTTLFHPLVQEARRVFDGEVLI